MSAFKEYELNPSAETYRDLQFECERDFEPQHRRLASCARILSVLNSTKATRIMTWACVRRLRWRCMQMVRAWARQ